MALYIGNSKKLKICLSGILYNLNFFTSSSQPITNGIRLLSSEGYMLKDSKGLYLTSKKEAE